MNRAAKLLKSILRIAILTYVIAAGGTFLLQRQALYHPDPTMADKKWLANSSVEHIATKDGQDLIAWWVRPADPTQRAYLYFHGSAGNLSDRADRFQDLTRNGPGLLAISWRGYGGSTGSPTEEGLMLDAHAAYDTLRSRVEPARIVLIGESLGTGVAAKLAAEVPVSAVLLDSAHTSISDVAAAAFPWLPARWLVWDEFRADLAAPSVTAPVFQVHSTDDPIIPVALARRLHDRFPNAQPLIEMPSAWHPVSTRGFNALLNAFEASID